MTDLLSISLLAGTAIIAVPIFVAIKKVQARNAIRRRLDSIGSRYHSGGYVDRFGLDEGEIPEVLRRGEEYCYHPVTTPVTWSQDGWVSQCKTCRSVLYWGDGKFPTQLDKPKSVERWNPAEVLRDIAMKSGREVDHESFDRASAWLESPIVESDGHRVLQSEVTSGDPLPAALNARPNIGGEGNPDYKGGNYVPAIEIAKEMKGIQRFPETFREWAERRGLNADFGKGE